MSQLKNFLKILLSILRKECISSTEISVLIHKAQK